MDPFLSKEGKKGRKFSQAVPRGFSGKAQAVNGVAVAPTGGCEHRDPPPKPTPNKPRPRQLPLHQQHRS